jgi:hypothetical protein
MTDPTTRAASDGGSALEWADPPAAKRDRGTLPRAAAELRAHPGRWAKVLTAATAGSSQAAAIKTGRHAAFRPAGHFEAATRSAGKTPKGTQIYDVYARYIGEPEATQ